MSEYEPIDDEVRKENWILPALATVIVLLIVGALCLVLARDHERHPDPKPTPLRSAEAIRFSNLAVTTIGTVECQAFDEHGKPHHTSAPCMSAVIGRVVCPPGDICTTEGSEDAFDGPLCIEGKDGIDRCTGPQTVWLRCNAGMEVTDLRSCPEYVEAYRAGQLNAIEIIRAYTATVARRHKTAKVDAAPAEYLCRDGWFVGDQMSCPEAFTGTITTLGSGITSRDTECRDCDCDNPAKHNLQECKDVRYAEDEYRKTCIALGDKWVDRNCVTPEPRVQP